MNGADRPLFPIVPLPGGKPAPGLRFFSVEGNGDVVTTTGDFRALGAGKGIILKSPTSNLCARISLNNNGTSLDLAKVTCP
ncbi:MAG: hypothetical protein A3G20_08735 [Acidobacteria bacterium RIFCSPLOWO2_12_FULL_59_11]|nr:MAG: hypothetical protein A3G20_08735 [Acidobacteria bacterium RIFCSPLOWO2_12_FULL_59_11]